MDRPKYTGQIKGFPLIKIKSKEIIDKIRAGSFHMSSLKKYREMYAESGDDTIGDPNEGKLIIHEAIMIVPEFGEEQILHDYPMPTANENDFVFCMFGINPMKYDTFQFSEEQKKKLVGFDDTALLITDAHEFCRRVIAAAAEKNLEIESGFVNYYDETSDDTKRLADLVVNGVKNIVYYKTQKYKYQQELRFTVPNKTGEDFLEFNIGDISDISEVFTTEEILSAYIAHKEGQPTI